MRKMLMAVAALFLMAGLAAAVEVSIVAFDKDKKELKYKEGTDEKTGKVDDKTKFVVTDKNGENAKDSDYATFEKRAGGGKGKLDITVKDGTITEVKWKGKK